MRAMEATLLEAPYWYVQRTDLVSEAEELLHLGWTAVGSTSLTLLQTTTGTLGELVRSELCGIWQDRPEVTDTLRYARELREAAQRRNSGRR